MWYFIKYFKSTKGRQKKIPHCNIYILRAWSPGSGLNDCAWEWKRQKGNIRITLWDSRVINRKPLPLAFDWLKNFLRDTLFSHTMYLLLSALLPRIPRVTTTYSAPTKHQVCSGSCQEVFLSLPLRCSVRFARENLRVLVTPPYGCTDQQAGFQRTSQAAFG